MNVEYNSWGFIVVDNDVEQSTIVMWDSVILISGENESIFILDINSRVQKINNIKDAEIVVRDIFNNMPEKE